MNKWSCGFHHGFKGLIIGILILINVYILKWDLGIFLGVLFIVLGVIHMLMNKTCTCEDMGMMKQMPKKKR